MYLPRVSIPAHEGTYSSVFAGRELVAHLTEVHGEGNLANVVLLLCSWISLLGDSPIADKKTFGQIKRFENRLVLDLTSEIRQFAALGDRLTRSVVRSPEGCLVIETYLKEFQRTPVFREYKAFVESGDPLLFRYLLSFCYFGKKLYYEDVKLEASSFRTWLEVEERLRTLVLPSFTSNLRVIMRWAFREWEDEDIIPKHGSGAVSESRVRGIEAKNSSIRFSPKAHMMYFTSRIWSRPTVQHLAPSGSISKNQLAASKELFARLLFVNKDVGKKRSICKEPVSGMYMQQAVRAPYERQIRRGILRWHVRINDQTLNQKASAYGARTGCIDTIDLRNASDSNSWDLVKAIHPSGILKHLAATRTSTVRLPQSIVESGLSGGVKSIDVKKFAPMGSALCFPVQSAVYSSVILLVSIAQALGRDWHDTTWIEEVDLDEAYRYAFKENLGDPGSGFEPFRCYGDDLATDNRVTLGVISALTELGFEVNQGKSFLGSSAFRESCGKYHLLGEDVTPLFFKVKHVNDENVPIDSLAGVIDLANRALDYGYLHLRRHLIQYCLRQPIEGLDERERKNGSPFNPILFSTTREDGYAIETSKPVNSHLRLRFWIPEDGSRAQFPNGRNFGHRKITEVDPFHGPGVPNAFLRRAVPWPEGSNQVLQRDEWLSITAEPSEKTRLSVEFDNYRYLQWWRTSALRLENDVEVVPQREQAHGLGLAWRWTAAS